MERIEQGLIQTVTFNGGFNNGDYNYAVKGQQRCRENEAG